MLGRHHEEGLESVLLLAEEYVLGGQFGLGEGLGQKYPNLFLREKGEVMDDHGLAQ